MTSSLGCEHQKPRVSSMMLASGGTIKSVATTNSGGGGSGGGYKSQTLVGNWFEDRFDSRFADGKTVLPTALEQSWRTTYHGHLGRPGWNGQAAVDRSALSCSTTQKLAPPLGHLMPLDPATQLSRGTMDLLVSLEAAAAFGKEHRPLDTVPLTAALGAKRDVSQQELAAIAAGRNRAFPGHQPERDLPPKDPEAEKELRFKTEMSRRYDDPEQRRHRIQTNAVDLFHGKANDKASFVIFKLNVELQQRSATNNNNNNSGSSCSGSTNHSSNNNASLPPVSPRGAAASPARGNGGSSSSPTTVERPQRFMADRNMSTIPVLSSVKPALTVAFTGTADVNVITSFSYSGLRRALRVAAKMDGHPTMNLAELKYGLNSYGVANLADSEIAVLFKHFDAVGTGSVDLLQFVAGVRGHMNERRKAVVQLAFQLVRATVWRTQGTECVRFRDVLALFDAPQHPDVKSGKRSADFVKQHIFEDYYVGCETAEGRAVTEDTPVTEQFFLDIFEDWSGLVNADFHFEATVRSCYHLTGGEGLSRCTSNINVEVIHTNGRITKQVLRDDLAVSGNDTELILEFLHKQGINDVKRFRVL